jgi:hypothetical protein
LILLSSCLLLRPLRHTWSHHHCRPQPSILAIRYCVKTVPGWSVITRFWIR